jgi:heavy metal sensor kinase
MSSGTTIKTRSSLALRLTLWYASIFTVTACLAFLLFYLLMTTIIKERADRDLVKQADYLSTLYALQGIEAVKRVVILEARASGEKKFFIRLLYPTGLVFSSSNMTHWKGINVERQIVKMIVDGRHFVFVTAAIPDRKEKVRIVYSMLGDGIILQLGYSLETDTRIFEAFRKILLLTMALLTVFSAGIGWFMARRALSGLASVTRTARQISGSDLLKRVPVTGKGDEIDHLAVTFNDMLDRIQRLITGIREMSDNIAHDLRSPITRIRGVAEITLSGEKRIEPYEQMAASTIEECDRLLDIINTMLIISETEAGIGKLTMEPVNLAEIIQSACELFRPLAEEKGIKLRSRWGEQPTIHGDVRLIQRMVANLLDNAVKYTPESGKIEVTLDIHDDHGESVDIGVTDTGIGIAEDDIPNIFNRFYRCDRSRSDKGIGLGLSLAKTIARAHGGDIEVSSSLSKGSRFTIRLPMKAS